MADPIVGLLHLEVVEAKELPAMDLNGKADPFCELHFGQAVARTQIVKANRAPRWAETFKYIVHRTESKYTIRVTVWDYDKASSNDEIGQLELDISVFLDHQVHDLWVPIHKGQKTAGQLHVRAFLVSEADVQRSFWEGYAAHFDADHSGAISSLEFTGMIGTLAPHIPDSEITQLYAQADVNHDNSISFAEFYQFITQNQELSRRLVERDPEFIWKVVAAVDEFNTVGTLVLEDNMSGNKLHAAGGASEQNKVIMVHNRETGRLEEEKIPHYIETSLRLMYSTGSGRAAVEGTQVRKLLKHLTVSQGSKYEDPRSRKEIPGFIEFHNLNTEEMLDPIEAYRNFNEFFYRKLKATARPAAQPQNPRVAVSPADSRLNVFPTLSEATRIWIKGRNFALPALLQDEALARQYADGSLVIARLAPQDYHRFHLPVDCTIGPSRLIDGAFYTVNPIAIREEIDVYTENKRIVTILRDTPFGEVVFVAVGATMVGSIILTTKEGDRKKKGDEHGYFAFGGSTVLVLFKQGTVRFDDDLIANSLKPTETLVKVGVSLGVSTV